MSSFLDALSTFFPRLGSDGKVSSSQLPPSGGSGGYVLAGEIGDFSAVTGHFYYVDAGGGAVNATLPVPVNGAQVIVKKTDSSGNEVTVLPHGAGSMHNSASFVISTQYEAITFYGDGSNWWTQPLPGGSGSSPKWGQYNLSAAAVPSGAATAMSWAEASGHQDSVLDLSDPLLPLA